MMFVVTPQASKPTLGKTGKSKTGKTMKNHPFLRSPRKVVGTPGPKRPDHPTRTTTISTSVSLVVHRGRILGWTTDPVAEPWALGNSRKSPVAPGRLPAAGPARGPVRGSRQSGPARCDKAGEKDGAGKKARH